MVELFLARDARADGRFVGGVLTTGVYCLPSCPARKPLAKNLEIFAGEDEARRAGLRACRRCRPDRFYRDHDPDRERLEATVARLAEHPDEFADVAALAHAAAVGQTKLAELAKRHFHATPLELLARARVERASERLATTRASAADVGFSVGFESLSAFHDNFVARTGLAPGEYRRMLDAREFELALPANPRPELAFAHTARDRSSPTEERVGARLERLELVDGRPTPVVLEHAGRRVRVRIESERAPSRDAVRAVHALAARILGLGGLGAAPDALERRVRRVPELARLVGERAGMRVPLSPSPFEAFVRTVCAQQVNLAFAFECRRDLVLRCGARFADGKAAHPTPAELAALDYRDLERLRFSRRKAEFLIDGARRIASGEFDLDGLGRGSATHAAKELATLRGLGPWSVQALSMFACGFADCVPLGDVGLARAAQELLRLDERPDDRRLLELLAPCAPQRSLASLHLWKSLGNAP